MATEFKRVRRIVEDALDLEGDERDRFVERSCGDDRELRDEVERLLRADAQHAEGLDATLDTGQLEADLSIGLRDAFSGLQLDGFRLLRPIGAGGSGTVYEAEQRSPKRRVAIKVLHLGRLGAREVERFEREAATLALLHHPSIATVHASGVADAGDARGELAVPYIALEYVDGALPLTEYADREQLDLEGRVRLLLQAAGALAHAHARGVVHRDVKPANLLVDAQGRVKVIDFGIARQDDTDGYTRTGEILGTLAYMAPEQLRSSRDIEASADVYALGAVLFELCTGRRPLDVANRPLPEAARVVTDEEPPNASAIAHEVPAEVDWICGLALSKEPERRYADAAAFAAELERFLTGEAVAAGPPTRVYRLRRFVARNRALVLSASSIIAILVVAVGLTTSGLIRAVRAEERASGERDEAVREARSRAELNQFLERLLLAPTPGAAGADVRVVELLDAAAAELAADSVPDDELAGDQHMTLASAYRSLGRYGDSVDQARLAVAAFDRAGVPAAERADARSALADALIELGRYAEAEADAREAVALAADAAQQGARDPGASRRLAEQVLGLALCYGGKLDEAIPLLERMQSEARAAGDELLGPAVTLATVYQVARRPADALEQLEAALDPLADDDPRRLAAENARLLALIELGRASEAVQFGDALLERFGSSFDPASLQLLRIVANLVRAHVLAGDRSAAVALLEQTLERVRARHGDALPVIADLQLELATLVEPERGVALLDEAAAIAGLDEQTRVRVDCQLSHLLRQSEQLDRAVESAERALERARELHGASIERLTLRRGAFLPERPSSDEPTLLELLAVYARAEAARAVGDGAFAGELLAESLTGFEPDDDTGRKLWLELRTTQAVLTLESGDFDTGGDDLETVLQRAEEWFPTPVEAWFDASQNLWRSAMFFGEAERALAQIERELAMRARSIVPAHQTVVVLSLNRLSLLRRLGRTDALEAAHRDCVAAMDAAGLEPDHRLRASAEQLRGSDG